MDLLLFLILLAVSGLIVGALGRLALPGKDPMSIPMTIGIGIAGSFISGVIWMLLFDDRGFAPFLLSVACTAGIVYFVRRSRGGGLMDPGAPPPDRG
ncbi:MAG: GlsB/YeaQ/YmgE family stress response membrane protein [Actinomycetota bacterium]|nr:GlsB/YeaQ/YmgE family stress response membrane protein [Actinomycetota bacterium]